MTPLRWFPAAGACLLFAPFGHAVNITLINADFELGETGAGFNIREQNNPIGWNTQDLSADPAKTDDIYVFDAAANGLPDPRYGLVLSFYETNTTTPPAGSPPGSGLATDINTGNYFEQAFPTSEVTADSFPEYNVEFDWGWRNNLNDNDIDLIFAIVNLTEGGTILASEVFDLDAETTSSPALGPYRAEGNDRLIVLSYDNSDTGLAGDEIGLRIITTTPGDSNFETTAWIDNISVSGAVPEPAAYGLLAGLAGLALVALRRRRQQVCD